MKDKMDESNINEDKIDESNINEMEKLENIDDKEIKNSPNIYFKNLYDLNLVQFCNFNSEGDLILFCKARASDYEDYLNLIYVYSINAEEDTKKCRNIYMAPKEAEIIEITEYDKIWLRIKDHIHEWNLH